VKKSRISKARADQEMASEYRFDYSRARPNRFAEGMKVGWTVQRFAGKEKKSAPKKSAAKKTVTKAKPAKKKK